MAAIQEHDRTPSCSTDERSQARQHASLPEDEASSEHAHDVVERTRDALELVFGLPAERTFTVRLWDGTTESPPASTVSAFTLVLNSPASLRAMFLPPTELRLAEAFAAGVFEVEGDLEAAQRVECSVRDRLSGATSIARILRVLARLPRPSNDRTSRPRRGRRRPGHIHSRARDAAAIRSHYDVGNAFYALWLDRRLIYSSAYFETGAEDLDSAQEAKLELICRKLRLRPGDHLLDVGCGWGALVIYAASRYGVDAVGITISEAQAAVAKERVIEAGIADRCRIEIRDYRTLPIHRQYDKVVSVGMFEHVGRGQLAHYVRHLHDLTVPGGLFLNCGIVIEPEPPGLAAAIGRRLQRQGVFIDRYVFPDGELVRLDELVHVAEAAGFETRDVEAHREHYARTLRRWVSRLERAEGKARALVGDETYRIWRLYMAASAHAFASGRLGIVQVLFAKRTPGGRAAVPLTRKDLYCSRSA